MDPTEWKEKIRRSLVAFYRDLGQASEGSRVAEFDGVVAAVVPAVPDRSIINSVVFESADALAAAMDRLDHAYAEAGVNAWLVWVPQEDRTAIELLEAAGHHLDGSPRLMAMELSELRAPAIDGIDWTAGADGQTIGRLNSLAYGLPEGEFTAAIGSALDGWHAHVGRLDGEPASCVVSRDLDGDAGIYLVATLPEARGRGISSALMGQALVDARKRGCETTTLQASAKGYSVYERLGYRDLGEIQLWERRR